jgi:hypothetical protein
MRIRNGAGVIAAETVVFAGKRMTAITSSRFADLEEIAMTGMMTVKEACEADATVVEVHAITAVSTVCVAVPGLRAYVGGGGAGSSRKKVIDREGMDGLDPLFAARGARAELHLKQAIQACEIRSVHRDRFAVNY